MKKARGIISTETPITQIPRQLSSIRATSPARAAVTKKAAESAKDRIEKAIPRDFSGGGEKEYISVENAVFRGETLDRGFGRQ